MKKLTLTTALCLITALSSWGADDQKMSATNTGDNSGDQAPQAQTSEKQSESKSDIQITASIRRKVVHDKSLSMDAKNVKIITQNGQTTLRGPVKSEEEKSKIEKYAQSGGASKVDNQLNIENQ